MFMVIRVFLLDLTLPFYFLHFLTSLIFFLQFLKFEVNLHTPPNESMDSTDEFSLSTRMIGTRMYGNLLSTVTKVTRDRATRYQP